MRSPGRPQVNQRQTRQAFWEHIAAGLSSEDAALACGVSQPLGPRWFREAGGMPPIVLAPPSGRYLSFCEREEIALLRAQRCAIREIARQLGRSPSTISRELRRNSATRGHPRRHAAVPGNGRPVEGRQSGRAPEGDQACAEQATASLCARAACGSNIRCSWQENPWTQRPVEGPTPRPPGGPTLGSELESGADQTPIAARLPRGRIDAYLP